MESVQKLQVFFETVTAARIFLFSQKFATNSIDFQALLLYNKGTT